MRSIVSAMSLDHNREDDPKVRLVGAVVDRDVQLWICIPWPSPRPVTQRRYRGAQCAGLPSHGA